MLMKVKKSYLILLAFACIILIATILIFNPFKKKDIWDLNEKKLKENILSIKDVNNEIDLLDVTPFQWDELYSFAPYMPKEKIYEVVGYKWDDISETVSEGMNQIVFLKDGKVVCYVYGYSSNNVYGISFDKDHYKQGVLKFNSKDNLKFKVKVYEKIYYLEQIK